VGLEYINFTFNKTLPSGAFTAAGRGGRAGSAGRRGAALGLGNGAALGPGRPRAGRAADLGRHIGSLDSQKQTPDRLDVAIH